MNGSGLDIIARIETPFAEKFGVPRQSGIADSPGRIVFEKPFRDVDAVRGLEGFSHIWLIWQFDRALRQGWSPTVRPPRLGGNERVGVFATRSPFRPNGLGLSAVELERVALDEPEGPVLYVRGADMVSGTPIVDIKPYLAYADSSPAAAGGFTGGAAGAVLTVETIPAVTQCQACGRQYEPVRYGRTCPHCQSPDTYLAQGSEMMIKEIEAVEEDDAAT